MLDFKRLVTKVQKTLRVQRLSATTGVKKVRSRRQQLKFTIKWRKHVFAQNFFDIFLILEQNSIPNFIHNNAQIYTIKFITKSCSYFFSNLTSDISVVVSLARILKK